MNYSEPRFSVIMPTRNYGHFLPRAVDSVLAQRGAEFELRVIDDGSTDDTPDIAAAYGDRIIYHRQPPAGPYIACRRGVEQTPPDRHIVFLDADDRLRPGFLRSMAEALRRRPGVGMLFGTVINITAEGREKPAPTPEVASDPLTNFDRFIRGRLELSAGGAVFTRSILDPLASVLDRFGSFHGLDRVLVARGLAQRPCRIIPDAVLEVHDHPHRLRDNADSFCATGLRAVDALFQPGLLPAPALHYKHRFLSRLLLEQGRLLYRRGRYREAALCYRRALVNQPAAALHSRHLRRMLISTLRAGLPNGLRRRMPSRSATPPHPVEEKPDMATARTTPTLSRAPADGGGDPASVPSPDLPGRDQRRAMSRDPLEYLSRCADQLGDTVRLDLDRTAYLLNRTDDIRHILATNPLNYDKEHAAVRWFRGIFGRSLPFLEGQEHRQHRRAMQSGFRPRALHHLPPRLAVHLDELSDRWAGIDGQAIDVAGAIRGVTIAAAARLILGVDRTDAAEHLFRAIQNVHRRTVALMGRPVAWPSRRPRFLPSKRRRQHRRAVRELTDAVLELIHQRRAGSPEGEDALSNILRLQADGSMPVSDAEVRDHCVNLLLAATDPIAYGICWALYFLAEHPETESEIIEESRRVLHPGPPDMQQLQQLDAARRTLLEALRLRPSTWLLERQALEADTLPSGLTLPAGCRVMICPYVLHRRPALHAAPHRFDPTRFTPESERQRSPYAYLPFGAGPRVCIGQHMATFIGTLTLAHLLPRFRFQPASDQPARFGTLNGFTIQPEDGIMMMRISRR